MQDNIDYLLYEIISKHIIEGFSLQMAKIRFLLLLLLLLLKMMIFLQWGRISLFICEIF